MELESAQELRSLNHIGCDRHSKGTTRLAFAAGNAVCPGGIKGLIVLAHTRRDIAGVQTGNIQVLMHCHNINACRAGLAVVAVDATALHTASLSLEGMGVVLVCIGQGKIGHRFLYLFR